MKSIALYYTTGGSDKVYHAEILKAETLKAEMFTVNFQYGRSVNARARAAIAKTRGQ